MTSQASKVNEQKAVEQVATPRSNWFRVEVSDCDGQVVAIETEMLTGRADIGDNEQRVIEKAIRHLAGFLGRPAAESLVSAAQPEGMVEVPVEPTEAMLLAAMEATGTFMEPIDDYYAAACDENNAETKKAITLEYQAMIAARPK